MNRFKYLSIFIIFIFVFFGANQARAATQVVLDDYVYGSECYGGTDDFYVDIPSYYSGSKVSLRATYDCADLGISLCSGWAASCNVNVSPGQRLNFQVSYYCGYCGDYEDDSWTVYADSVTGPVCGNGSCESGETCSNCSSDCGSCPLKSDGSSCSSASECSGGYCVHSKCRSSATYCGDTYCDYNSGESCSNCSGDCGCVNSCCSPSASYHTSYGCVPNGMETASGICCSGTDYSGNCCSNTDCASGQQCTNHQCAASSYCGNGVCDSGESCSGCSTDCGDCKKSNGSSCGYSSECSGGYCVHYICRSVSVYCGDGYCDSGENCSSCSSDCGGCQEKEIVKKADGEYCDKNEECTSGNCQNYRCCLKNKTCCISYNNCSSEEYCSGERHYCIPRLPDGQFCRNEDECKSGNCKNYTCCVWGQACCKNHSDCDENDYCQSATYYCRDKWSLGSTCGDYGQDMCLSGYCNPDTWKCAEKPPGITEPASPAPTAATETVSTGEEIVISSNDLSLLTYVTKELLITIQNKSPKEVILGDYVLIENPIPYSVNIEKSALQIYKKKLLPNEVISTEGQGGQRETIEKMTLNSLKQGSGAIKLKVVYFIDNRAKWAEDELSVSISASHTEKEEAASQVFSETMLWEGREVDYTASGAEKEYIFVSVEDKSLQQAAINDWQANHKQMEEAVENLKDDFAGTLKPEILSFFETIKGLEEAKSSQEITEASIRALAPPVIVAGFDFANLLDAVDKQKKLERGLLTHFDATDFVIVPIRDSQRNITGYAKTIVKEKDGKFYAVKVGEYK